ncbi:MAG: hypothetical protein HKN19_08305 [Halioglobus sp.]|nr:hypothetical protein [Halioglobus sp.]
MADSCGPIDGSCRESLLALADQWQPLLLWASGLSLLLLVATLVAVPVVVTRLPADYFVRAHRRHWREESGHPALVLALAVIKNGVGLLLVVLGAIMLVTPGQGVLTLLAGLLLMNFPGKYRLERWLVLRPGVLSTLNWLRRRKALAEFETPN